MKLRELLQIPQNILQTPAGILDCIEVNAAARKGVVTFYIPVPIQYPTKAGMRWKTAWQLLDYNIDTDEIVKLYRYTMGKQPKTMPPPRPEDVGTRAYFTAAWLPKAAVGMLRKKVKYYKVGAKKE